MEDVLVRAVNSPGFCMSFRGRLTVRTLLLVAGGIVAEFAKLEVFAPGGRFDANKGEDEAEGDCLIPFTPD